MATIQTFNCTGAGTTIVPLKRPYYCCGWALPPLSFSGRYTCYKTGTPPVGCNETGPEGVAIKYELMSDCIFDLLSGNIPRYIDYVEVLNDPPVISAQLWISLDFCVEPDGSDKEPFAVVNPPVLAAPYEFECSYDIPTGNHTFHWESTGTLDFGGGNTVYISLVFDTVEFAT